MADAAERRGAKRTLDTSSDFELPAVLDTSSAQVADGATAAGSRAADGTDASAARRVSQRQKQVRRSTSDRLAAE